MRLVVPRGDAGFLDNKAHGAPMIGAIQEESIEQLRVTGHRAAAQSGRVRSLRQAIENDEVRETVPSELLCGLERTERRPLVEDLRVALIGRDHEAVLVGTGEEGAPF